MPARLRVERPTEMRPVPGDAHGLLRRGRAWAPAAKSAALFLLSFPLVIAALGALIAGDVPRLALTGGALACLWGAGVLVWRALVADARFRLGERVEPPAMPLKLMSALATAIGAALAAVAGGHGAASASVFAGLGAVGHVAFFGRDLRRRRIRVAVVDGVDAAAVRRQLEQAWGRLRGIEGAARAIAVPEFRDRLSRITAIGRSILERLERHPGDAARARRFLHLYLDSVERVTMEYARLHGHVRDRPLEQHFRRLLVDMERTFAGQYDKLVARDLVSLDVDIEVLNERIRREGPG